MPFVALPVTRVAPDVAFASCGSWQSMQLAWRWPAPVVTPSALPKVAFANSAAVSCRVSEFDGWPDWFAVVA